MRAAGPTGRAGTGLLASLRVALVALPLAPPVRLLAQLLQQLRTHLAKELAESAFWHRLQAPHEVEPVRRLTLRMASMYTTWSPGYT